MLTDFKHILIIEGNPNNPSLTGQSLVENHCHSFEFSIVDRQYSALSHHNHEMVDVILLDLSLTDSSGIETVQLICKANPKIPVIVLAESENDRLAIEAVQMGAQDYLIKNQVNNRILYKAIRYAIERKKMEERLHYMAMHDTLTGLPNRAYFQDHLNKLVTQCQKNQNGSQTGNLVAVMLLDLDHFKTFNDTLGHLYGDCLLKAIAERLQLAVRKSDMVARMGGDEFTLIFDEVNKPTDVNILGQKILNLFATPFDISGEEFHMTASIGISLFPEDGDDFESLLKAADIAMYVAKGERNRYAIFTRLFDDRLS